MRVIFLIVFISISILSKAQTFLDSVRLGKITMEEYVNKHNSLDKFDKAIVSFKENGKWGFKDKNGKVIITPKYDETSEFQHHVASVKLNGKSGLINKFDNLIISYGKYDVIYTYKEKRARVKKNNLFGVIDENGKEIVPCIYKSSDTYGFGLCQLTDKNNKEGIVDLNGNIVIPFVYDELSQMELDGIIKAKKEGKYGYINYKNEVLVKFDYDFVNYPTFGMIGVKKNKKFGFVNIMGREIVPCIYDTVYQFEETGKATVIKNRKYGYVLKDGTEKITK